jgi:hypothetical protein
MDLKRENTDQSVSVKKRLSEPQHTRVQLHVEEVGYYKMFFTAVEIVSFEGVDRNFRG